MYCPAELHDKTSKHPTLAKLTDVWKSIVDKTQHLALPYKISFTGGEVTANKSFLPLVEYLQTGSFNIGQLLVTTNGSASLNYYKRLSKSVDAISFSTHSEFFDEAVFFNKVQEIDAIMLRPAKSVHVNIMDEYWNKDRNELYKQLLEKNQVSYSLNTINYNVKIRDFPLNKGKLNLV
jgi:organic radical activating enzyme